MSERHQVTMDRAQRWLKENTKRYAFKKLEKDIIQPGVCVECGSCVESCPADALTGDLSSGKYVPTLTGNCTSCGVCYAMCPRTYPLWTDVAGHFRSIWKARSTGEHRKQDGGVVTALLGYMLDHDLIDAAVVACRGDSKPWMPEARLVEDAKLLSDCGGTIYSHASVVGKMMEGFKNGALSVAVVGTSCDIDAVERMKQHPAGYLSVDRRRSVFSIGLFCMESFEYPKLKAWLKSQEVDIDEISRFEISGGKFRVRTPKTEHEWPVSELDSAASTSCAYCHDLTSMNADLSCGNIGSEEGFTTVIVRTVAGEQVLQEAVQEGRIEAELTDPKSLGTIQNVARSKRYKYYGMKPKH